MATRIYLPYDTTPQVTPSTWNFAAQTGTTYTYRAYQTKQETTMTTLTQPTGTTSPIYRGMVRYVIGTLQAVQISGTVNLCLRARESNAGANATVGIAVKIITPAGADRSVLLAYTASDLINTVPYELTTTLESHRAFDASEGRPITLTAQTPTAGDYLVIEIGFRSQTSVTRNIEFRVGDTGSTDLTDGDGETNDYPGWCDFSQTLSWEASTAKTPWHLFFSGQAQ